MARSMRARTVYIILGAAIVLGLLLNIFGPDLARAATPTCRIGQTTSEAATIYAEGLAPLPTRQTYLMQVQEPTNQLIEWAIAPPAASQPFLDPIPGVYEGKIWQLKQHGAEHNSFEKATLIVTCTLTR